MRVDRLKLTGFQPPARRSARPSAERPRSINVVPANSSTNLTPAWTRVDRGFLESPRTWDNSFGQNYTAAILAAAAWRSVSRRAPRVGRLTARDASCVRLLPSTHRASRGSMRHGRPHRLGCRPHPVEKLFDGLPIGLLSGEQRNMMAAGKDDNVLGTEPAETAGAWLEQSFPRFERHGVVRLCSAARAPGTWRAAIHSADGKRSIRIIFTGSQGY